MRRGAVPVLEQMQNVTVNEAKRVLEAALLCAPQPLAPAQLQRLLGAEASGGCLDSALRALQQDWSVRGLELVRTALGWRFQTRPDIAHHMTRLAPEAAARPSRALLETLAVIAYRQPVTRGDVEAVRGVAVNSALLRQLEERGWVQAAGHRESIGRPQLYVTTPQFLDDLGLQSLDDLPPLPGARALEDLARPARQDEME